MPRIQGGTWFENTYITDDGAKASAQPGSWVSFREKRKTELAIDGGMKFNLVIHNSIHARSRVCISSCQFSIKYKFYVNILNAMANLESQTERGVMNDSQAIELREN